MNNWNQVLAEAFNDIADTLREMEEEAENPLLVRRLTELEVEMREVADIHQEMEEEING